MYDFQQAFNDADMVLALPIYTAGEAPIEGVSSDALVHGLRDRGHRHASTVADAGALAASLAASIKAGDLGAGDMIIRSEEHTSELQSLMRISYAVFCLKKKKN